MLAGMQLSPLRLVRWSTLSLVALLLWKLSGLMKAWLTDRLFARAGDPPVTGATR